jgi:hypothetical protein
MTSRLRPAAAVRVGILSAVFLVASVGSSSARTGWSSGNGIASESTQSILAATVKAADSLRTVRVYGTVNEDGSKVGLNLSLRAGVGSQGSLTLSGHTVQLVTLGKTVYLKGDAAFWKSFGNSAVASLLAGKWLAAPATGSFASIAKLGTLTDLFNTTFSSHGKLVKSATTKVDGVAAIGLRDTTNGGTLYVATTGKPYPLELVKSGTKSGGALTFTGFNAPLEISAPKGAISLGQLKSAG